MPILNQKDEIRSSFDGIDYGKYTIMAYFIKISLCEECLPNIVSQGMIYL
jgi:hypothetical protein